MTQDLYDPAFVAEIFDRCSANYRNWSGIASFGMIRRWRRQCVAGLALPFDTTASGVDLMAGTGEIWPHLLARYPNINKVTAIDISEGMHKHAVKHLHTSRSDQIEHLCADILSVDLPEASADFAVSSFGLKTFNAAQHTIFAQQLCRILKPGAPFSLVEATDPVRWSLRPLYRMHLDLALPLVERVFLKGAQDFAMIGTYTKNFGDGHTAEQALRAAGLVVQRRDLIGGCAVLLTGHRPSLTS